jgi:hypothetical protein
MTRSLAGLAALSVNWIPTRLIAESSRRDLTRIEEDASPIQDQ